MTSACWGVYLALKRREVYDRSPVKDSDKTAPATKEDIAMMMDSIGTYYDRMDTRMNNFEEKIESKMEQWTRELIEQTDHRFQVVAEELRHDLLGIHSDKVDLMNDKLKSHDRRLNRLEAQAGIAA